MNPNKQYWAVCLGNQIVRVYENYDKALAESTMFTLETGVTHDVQPAKLRKGTGQ